MPLPPTAYLACALAVATLSIASPARAQRALGLDVSAWQGNISAANWAALHRPVDQLVGGVAGDGRDFVYIRSSRGGTTGYYNQSDSDNSDGLNTLSQRYDDHYFVQNITRATAAGLFAGAYHFSRPDVVTDTLNSNGIANTGTDEANHFIQMSGAWMRPGYLMPTHDLEAGDGIRSDNEMAQFALDFSNRVHDVMGIRPALYINGNYAHNIIGGASSTLRNAVVAAHPTLWIARWPNQADPAAIDVQNMQPNASLSYLYGPWDDSGVAQPWEFWQYASTARLNGYANGTANLDVNVANGGTEFLKDQLVPALLVADAGAQNWSTLATWNSGQAPIAPVQGAGQVARVGTLTLPAARLPGANDTVILDRPNAAVTVTLDAGTHTIRKLYVRETLNIAGGSLTIGYVPTSDSTPISAQFSANVTVSGTASLSVHTLQVDASRTLKFAGGAMTFKSLKLLPGQVPAKLVISLAPDQSLTIAGLAGATAIVSNGAGSGSTGWVDLADAFARLNIPDGSAATDVSIEVPVRNGALTKLGAGTLRLAAANNYVGATTVEAGTLVLGVASGAHQPILGGANVPTPGGADVRGGRLVFDYAGGATPATSVKNALTTSYDADFAGGLFRSSGLDAGRTLGWLDNGAGSLSVVRTLFGDANLDLLVNFDDLLVLAQNYGGPGIWKTGDFNYDASVNFDDLLALAQQYGGAGFTGSFEADWALAQSLVPEPSALLAVTGALAFRGRRRQT